MRVGPVLAIDKKNQANLIIFDWLYIYLWEISNFYNIMEEKDEKFIFGVLKVGDKGQIVIPRDALLLLGDKKGMALVKTEIFQSAIEQVMDDISK